MYDLNNKIRLIDVSRYPIGNSEQFVGFVCGIISQDNDLEQMYFDNFLKISGLSEEGTELLTTINSIFQSLPTRMILRRNFRIRFSLLSDIHE